MGRTQREGAIGDPPHARRARDAVADARVLALLARHEASLMRVARQWSLCQDDAYDAFQRGLEIYVRRVATVDVATEAAWLKVVIRHEAIAIRRSRAETVTPDVDLDLLVPADDRSVEEQILSGDRVSRSAETLRSLKPDQARALMLKAHGLSYQEIARHCGWTYTKVNRAITEGRRRFMEIYGALESGEACAAFAPTLEALARGTASSQQLVEVRPHLRRCAACRATVRELHRSDRRGIGLLLPLPALPAPLRWIRDRVGHGSASAPTADPTTSDPSTLHLTPLPGPRLPVPPGPPGERLHVLHRARQHATSLLHRTNSPDLAAGIHIAATSGGGRVATLGAILGLCLGGVGAGTVCVVTGIIDDPLGLFDQPHGAVRAHAPAKRAPVGKQAAGPTLAADHVAVRAAATPSPTATPTPRRPVAIRHRSRGPMRSTPPPAPAATADPAQGTTPTSQQYAPVSPAPAQPAAQEFAAAPAAGTGTHAAPAAAPATGGGEFGP